MKIQRIALTLLVSSLLLSAKACSQAAKPEDISSSPCEDAVVAATFENPYGYEKLPILLCRGLKTNLQTTWPQLKTWR